MAKRVFCIDFGSSYTKVGLRRDPGAEGEVIRSPLRTVSAVDFCFPSAVGVERQGTKTVPLFGEQAMQCRQGPNLHANWKRKVFLGAEPGKPPQKSPLDAFLESPELTELAKKYGVSESQVVHLHNLVASARALAGGPATATVAPDAQDRATAAPIAYHYFTWLRQQVTEACTRLQLDGLDPERIPARITVPAFAKEDELAAHPGSQLLLHALGRAGWTIHPERPIVSEPYSNAIGVLTGGTNVLHKSRVHFGRMFGKCPLLLTLGDKAHYQEYRALVVDVGAFTTDFGVLSLNLNGQTIDDPDVAFTVRQRSVPVGVTNLDARVFAALPPDKGNWLRKTAQPVEVEGFRRSVYANGTYRTVEVGAIGGASDAEAVQTGMESFLHELSVEAEKFCGEQEPIAHQELILTGGGSAIPRIRDTLLSIAQKSGRTYVRYHAPGLKKGAAPNHTYNLKEEMYRGGSAIGGTSIFFEKEFY